MPSTLNPTAGARGASAPLSTNVAGTVDGGFTVEDRLLLVGQLKARRFSEREHADAFSRGLIAAIDHVIRELFPLPTPVYSCSFPTDDVSRGLRELASAAFADIRSGVVHLDLSDVEDR